MSQYDFGTINTAETSGNDLAALLAAWRNALNTNHAGNARPAYVQPGGTWIDTASAGSWLFKMWTGTADAVLGKIDTATGTFTPYMGNAALKTLATLGVGEGLESSGGNLRIKLDGASLSRGADGLKLASIAGLVPGAYANVNITVDEFGRVVAIASGEGGGGGNVGDMLLYMGTTPPPHFFELDGSLPDRDEYPELFDHLSSQGLLVTQGTKQKTQFGTGDGVTTYGLGDWRGEFVRVWSHGSSVNSGRVLASWENFMVESHGHSYVRTVGGSGIGQSGSNNVNGSGTTGSYGGVETRPRSGAAMLCIRYE